MSGIYSKVGMKANCAPIMEAKVVWLCYYSNSRCISWVITVHFKLVVAMLHQQASKSIHMQCSCLEMREQEDAFEAPGCQNNTLMRLHFLFYYKS